MSTEYINKYIFERYLTKDETARTDLNKLIEFRIFDKIKEGKKFFYYIKSEYLLK